MHRDYFFKAEKKQKHYADEQPVFFRKAVFSDTTNDYVSPMEPLPYDEVTIRIRTARNNMEHVFLVGEDNMRLPMLKWEQTPDFDYYAIKVQVGKEKFEYYFELQYDQTTYYYDQRGVVVKTLKDYAFRIFPGFITPDWAKGAVMYQIFVDRFYNGDPSNDVLSNEYQYLGRKVEREENWEQYPKAEDGGTVFYGGDLQGILDKLDYLQELGVEVIYLNPIFLSPSNHKYNTQDYEYVDPHLGRIVHDEGKLLYESEMDNRKATRYIDRVTNPENLKASNQFFVDFIKEIHQRGMRIILDGVFNHCGSFHKWLDR